MRRGIETSRRNFLFSALATAGFPRAVPFLPLFRKHGSFGSELTARHANLPPFPAAETIARFRGDQHRLLAAFRPSGLNAREYLRLARGIVHFFKDYQDARGAVIDPYAHSEKQYSTPAFACAAAVLVKYGDERALLPHCMKAMDRATADLPAGRAADGHSNFYTILLMHALRVLTGSAPNARLESWRRNLASVIPERIYRAQPDSPHINNWNLVAASGEWLRFRAGLTKDRRWVDASVARQQSQFTDSGMYRDPHDPMAYDQFTRAHITDMLLHGYDGPLAPRLAEWMDRGAWMGLFMQSPCGELPCGGRSAHHQWNEATLAMVCEVYVRHFARRGDPAAAGAFKRAARLALQSVGRWVRPSGELWIVKNRYDPSLRWGYETYSFHSQYNLLTAAFLSIAFLHADESILEQPCPAETGGFVIALQPAFHKVFANAAGTYLEIDTGADPHYNPTGLLRVHHSGINPQLTVSDGVVVHPSYQIPSEPQSALAIGPAWKDAVGQWHSLAGHGGAVLQEAGVKLRHVSPEKIEFEIAYSGALRGGAKTVRQHYQINRGRIELTGSIEGEVRGMRQMFPLLTTDGQSSPSVEVSGRRVTVTNARGEMQSYTALDSGHPLSRLRVPQDFRNGQLDAAFCESGEKQMRCAIEPQRSSD